MNIFVFQFKRMLKSFLVWSGIVSLTLVLLMAFFPSVAENGAKGMLDSLPPALLQAFGLSRVTDLSDLLRYYAYIAQFILMAGCIYAVILGLSALTRKKSEGAGGFPGSRSQIITMKMLSGVIVLWAFNIILFIVSLLVLQVLRAPGYEYLPMLLAMFTGMLAAEMVFLAVGFALSTLLPRSRNVGWPALGVFFVTYLPGFAAAVSKDLRWMKYLSPYHYVQPSSILSAHGGIDPTYTLIMFMVTVLAIFFAYWRYRPQDLSV